MPYQPYTENIKRGKNKGESTPTRYGLNLHLSSPQNPCDIPLNPDWLIGILIIAYERFSRIVFLPVFTANHRGQLVLICVCLNIDIIKA